MERHYRPGKQCETPTNEPLFPSMGCQQTVVCTGRVKQLCEEENMCAGVQHMQEAPMYSQNMPPPQQTGVPIGDKMYNVPMEPPREGYDDIQKTVHSRTVTVFATFSAVEAQSNPKGQHVIVLEGDKIFKKKINLPQGERSQQSFGDTSTMIMHSVDIVSFKNSHFVPVAVDITGVPGGDCTASGERHATIIHSLSSSTQPTNYKIHRPLAFFRTSQFQRYIGISLENLNDGIEPADPKKYPPGTVVVSPNTVAADVLRRNKDTVNKKFDLDRCVTSDGRFLIGQRYMNGLMKHIYETVVTKMPYTDFAKLRIKLSRADASAWTSPGGVLKEYQNDPDFLENVALGTPHTVEMKLVLNYLITNLVNRGAVA